MSNVSTLRAYAITAPSLYFHGARENIPMIFDAQPGTPPERAAMRLHFKNACILLSREVEHIADHSQPMAPEDAEKLAASLAALLKTQALLYSPQERERE